MLLVNCLLCYHNTNTNENVRYRSRLDIQRICSVFQNVQTDWSTISVCLIGTVGSSPGLKRPGRQSKKGKITGENCVIRSYIICALYHLVGQRLR
jgi:hypothetical protein